MLAKLNEGRRSTAALTGMMQRQRGKDTRRFKILGENQYRTEKMEKRGETRLRGMQSPSGLKPHFSE
ncbi:MAG: hypothetical protein IKP32_01700 [Clostridia bacterium]|nr:hypothetical protein [Clostridia bacterium]